MSAKLELVSRVNPRRSESICRLKHTPLPVMTFTRVPDTTSVWLHREFDSKRWGKFSTENMVRVCPKTQIVLTRLRPLLIISKQKQNALKIYLVLFKITFYQTNVKLVYGVDLINEYTLTSIKSNEIGEIRIYFSPSIANTWNIILHLKME
jgi:hypothetical protein